MGWQLIAMRVGMGIMPRSKGRLGLRVVSRVGMRVIHGVVPVLFLVALLVLAGLRPDMGLRITGVWSGFVSR